MSLSKEILKRAKNSPEGISMTELSEQLPKKPIMNIAMDTWDLVDEGKLVFRADHRFAKVEKLPAKKR